jgi:hypothetical protein
MKFQRFRVWIHFFDFLAPFPYQNTERLAHDFLGCEVHGSKSPFVMLTNQQDSRFARPKAAMKWQCTGMYIVWKESVIEASALDAQMTNSSGTNLDIRSMPERPSPWMGLVSGSKAGAGIVPYNPSAFPPSMEVMPNRRVPVITGD